MDALAIQPSDLYNMDETGFRIGVAGSQWIITLSPDRESYLASSEERELVTDIEAVSADGSYLPNMLILQHKTHTEALYPAELDDNTLVGFTNSGYVNDERALEWLQHFDKYSKRRQQGA